MTFSLFKNVRLPTYRRIWVILLWTLHYVTTSEVILLLVVGSKEQKQKHTTGGIPRWSPTLVLVARFSAYVWQSGRDAQFSLTYGRMCFYHEDNVLCNTDNPVLATPPARR
jgi:hypothetical protein